MVHGIEKRLGRNEHSWRMNTGQRYFSKRIKKFNYFKKKEKIRGAVWNEQMKKDHIDSIKNAGSTNKQEEEEDNHEVQGREKKMISIFEY